MVVEMGQQHKLAQDGIWTPWAKVLCYGCHGNQFETHRTKILSEEEMKKHQTPTEIREHNGLTVCDTCGCQIQVSSGVAGEHNLVLKLKALGINAKMEQTGGMNSAATIEKEDGGYYLITYDFDGDKKYFIGSYNSDCELAHEENAQFETLNETEMIVFIKNVLNVND